MTAWSESRRLAALERDHDRQLAMAVVCTEPGCHAAVGEPCRNVHDEKPLVKQAAHLRRIRAGQERERLDEAFATEGGGT